MPDTPRQFRYANPLDLPRIGVADLLGNRAGGVCVDPPGTPRHFVRQPPRWHDDPDGARLFPRFQPLSIDVPPTFTLSLQDAGLAGYRSLLTRDGLLVNDLAHLTAGAAADFARALGQSNEILHLRADGEDGVFTYDPGDAPEIRLAGTVVVLTSAEPGNFGSFVYRELTKLVDLGRMPDDWRFLIHAPHRTFIEFLELAGIPERRIIQHDIHACYRIEQAVVPGLRAPYAFADPPARALYERLRLRCAAPGCGSRIYVSRHAVNADRRTGRVMLNEDDLIAALRPLGFDIVEPERMSAAEQVARFAAADLVVGPSGSGMFNAVFCRPGTKLIDIESEPHWIYPHANLFASAGLDYGIFEGTAQNRDWSRHHKPWRVNIEALLARLTTILDAGEAAVTTPPKDDAPIWSVADLSGDDYEVVLRRLHQALRPRTYLEIGVAAGATLELAQCASIAIDPAFHLERSVTQRKPMCLLYQMTSDDFFRDHDPTAILGRKIDLAFLDGMHWFEYLLRDFMNVERHCTPDSVILMHDCIPTDEFVARRDLEDDRLKHKSAHPEWWAGDVWKVLAILRRYRPDLTITTFDAAPTGLVAVSNLDPESTVLAEHYTALVEEFSGQTIAERGVELFAPPGLTPAAASLSPDRLTALLQVRAWSS